MINVVITFFTQLFQGKNHMMQWLKYSFQP
jgi:hypothetical protein